MPVYSYQCLSCGREFDDFSKVGEYRQEKPCISSACSGLAIKIVASPGTVLTDTPSWLDDPQVQGALLDTDSRKFRPIETRSQLKKHLKDKGLCESPSSGARWI